MSVELIKESVRVFQVIGEELTQTIFENDIIVPDTKPDITRVLLLDGDTYIKAVQVFQDKVFVDGGINYKILYVPDGEDKTVRSINTSSSFSQEIEIPGALNGMKCTIKPYVEHIENTILNGRKINTKAILKFYTKVSDDVDIGIVGELRGLDNIQTLRETANVSCYTGETETKYVARESLVVPSGKPTIAEVLRNDIKITGKDIKIAENKVVVKGDLNVSTLYIADDETRSIQFMEHEIPFTQLVDLGISGEDAGCNVDCDIAEAVFVSTEDSDGELRVIDSEITLNITTSGYISKQVEMIADAYSPRTRLEFEKEAVRLEEVAAESKSQIILKDTITIEGDVPEIAEVFNVLCKPSLSDYSIADNRVVVEGAITNSILYLSGNQEFPVSCFDQDILFKQGIDLKDIKPDMKCDIDLDIEHCNYSMISSTEVEIRLVVGVSIKAIAGYELPLISKVTEAPIDEMRISQAPSITLYFSQPGDTLWKIAKKYCIPIESLQRVNDLASDNIAVGQQIIIPRSLL